MQGFGIQNQPKEKSVGDNTKHMEKGSSGSVRMMKSDFDYFINSTVPDNASGYNISG